MKKQKLILELQDFINKYIKENNNNIVSSNTVYNYFCFLYQKNTKELTINAFIPYFCKIYQDLKNKQLNKKIFKLNKKTIRCLEDIELVPCILFDSTINFNKMSTPRLNFTSTPSSTTLVEKPIRAEIFIQTDVQDNIKKGSTLGSTYYVDQGVDPIVEPDFTYIKEWLLKYCKYEENSDVETPIYILKENYSKHYLNNIVIENKYNRTFVGKIKEYSKKIWLGSNLKKEDRQRKENTAFIKGLIIK